MRTLEKKKSPKKTSTKTGVSDVILTLLVKLKLTVSVNQKTHCNMQSDFLSSVLVWLVLPRDSFIQGYTFLFGEG